MTKVQIEELKKRIEFEKDLCWDYELMDRWTHEDRLTWSEHKELLRKLEAQLKEVEKKD